MKIQSVQADYFSTTGIFKFTSKPVPASDEHHSIRVIGKSAEFILRKVTPISLKKRKLLLFLPSVYAVEHTREDGSKLVIHFGMHNDQLNVKSIKVFSGGTPKSLSGGKDELVKTAVRLSSLTAGPQSKFRNKAALIEFSTALSGAVNNFPSPALHARSLEIL